MNDRITSYRHCEDTNSVTLIGNSRWGYVIDASERNKNILDRISEPIIIFLPTNKINI